MAEDRRVALAALAVTAVVGVAAPLGTILATNSHDSRRLRMEQAQTDRMELRAVLDRAASSLDVAGRRLGVALTQRRRLTLAQFVPLQAQLDDVTQAHNRVAIRLGRHTPASRRMRDALLGASAVYDALFAGWLRQHAGGPLPVGSSRNAVVDRLDRFDRLTDRFVDAAHDVARARLE